MESRTDPMDPNLIGDDSVDAEIAGEQGPLKMHEDGPAPPPGALDTAFPDTSPTESAQSDPGMFGDRAFDNSEDDPGQRSGSRDPSIARSAENDDRPGAKEGGTPYDAEGTSGSEGV